MTDEAKYNISENNMETARRVLEAKGFKENQYSLTGFTNFVTVSFNLVTLKDNSDFTSTKQSKVKLDLYPSEIIEETYTLKELDMELLALAKEKVAEIKEAWKISTL